MNTCAQTRLIALFATWAGEPVMQTTPLPASGSYREYLRLTGPTKTALGAYNRDAKENRAFLEFSRHFHAKGLAVPAIYADDLEQHVYLLEDLGDVTLFAYLQRMRQAGEFPAAALDMYRRVIRELPRFQIEAGADLNYAVCYPRASFDQQSMLWDLNYFKYYVLKFAQISFDEQDLEDDFHRFAEFLRHTEQRFFLYRDFQSRNIMLHREQPYFIDYQGGRRGALAYDLASLLYDAKADLPQSIRQELLAEYLRVVSAYLPLDEREFTAAYEGYALIRMMQALGAYGFRGLYERKAHFVQSIPYALRQLAVFLDTVRLPVTLPALWPALHQVAVSDVLQQAAAPRRLTVHVNSFSYKRGLPVDLSGNGGGYVFDCRVLPNPGRYPEYQTLTGQDQPVIEFFSREPALPEFLTDVYALVDRAVANYQSRDFADLTVSFGCTGGQHRSVYCAEQLARHLRDTAAVEVELRHLEFGKIRPQTAAQAN